MALRAAAVRVAVAALALVALCAGLAAAERAGEDPAVTLVFSKCKGFTDTAGRTLRESQMFVGCEHTSLDSPRLRVGKKGSKATYKFGTVPDFVHCSTFTKASGSRSGPFAKWFVLGKELRSGTQTVHFQDPAHAKRKGECTLSVQLGGEDAKAIAGSDHLYGEIVEVKGLNEHSAKARTTRAFIEGKYAGLTAGKQPAKKGAVYNFGPLAKRKAAAYFDLLDGPLKHLSFSALELNPEELNGKTKTYKMNSDAGELGLEIRVRWTVAKPAEYAKLVADKKKKEEEERKAERENKETNSRASATPSTPPTSTRRASSIRTRR